MIDHVEKGLRVSMTATAAYTVRNRLDEVRELGIAVVAEGEQPPGFEGELLTLEEVNLRQLQGFLIAFGEDLSDVDIVAVAVQDHGVFPEGMRNRRFRIQKMRERLEGNPNPANFAFREEEIPPYLVRMKSAAHAAQRQLPHAKVLLMDTSPDALLGCLKDPAVEKARTTLVVNVGNGHTIAAIVSEATIVGVMEHHTRRLNAPKIERLLVNFADGKLTDEQVFNDNGHGVFYLSPPPRFSQIECVAATGPNRGMLTNTSLSVHFAAPAGDVMMTGPVGLVEAAKRKFKLE